MEKLERARYDWLLGAISVYDGGKNTYYGSHSINKKGNSALNEEFRYTVFVVSENKVPQKITARWYVGCYCFDKTPEENITTRDFEASEKGCEEAFDYLQECYGSVREKGTGADS